MSHQFKPGDLALIISSKRRDSPNIGKVVTLEEVVSPGDFAVLASGAMYRNDGPGLGWVVRGIGLLALKNGIFVDAGNVGFTSERNLMPLRGDFIPEQQKAKEAESC